MLEKRSSVLMNRIVLEFVMIEKVESVRIAFGIHKCDIMGRMNALFTPMKITQELISNDVVFVLESH